MAPLGRSVSPVRSDAGGATHPALHDRSPYRRAVNPPWAFQRGEDGVGPHSFTALL